MGRRGSEPRRAFAPREEAHGRSLPQCVRRCGGPDPVAGRPCGRETPSYLHVCGDGLSKGFARRRQVERPRRPDAVSSRRGEGVRAQGRDRADVRSQEPQGGQSFSAEGAGGDREVSPLEGGRMSSGRTRMALLMALLAGSAESSSQAGDEARREITVEAFKVAIKETRSIDQKADLIRLLGGAETVDVGAVVEIARFLAGSPADINFQLPLASASALANFRGNKAASQSLIQAISYYKKTLFVQKRLLAALGQVGHESALPLLEDLTRGTDGDVAVLAVGATADLPADLALDSLIRSWDWMVTRRPKVGDDVKNLYDRIGGEILKAVQQISSEKYPTMPEMQRWWQKHKAEWKDIAAGRERDRGRQ